MGSLTCSMSHSQSPIAHGIVLPAVCVSVIAVQDPSQACTEVCHIVALEPVTDCHPEFGLVPLVSVFSPVLGTWVTETVSPLLAVPRSSLYLHYRGSPR